MPAILIRQSDVPATWPYCAPQIARALEHSAGEYTLEDVARFVRDAEWQLWALTRPDGIFGGAATTQLVRYPSTQHVIVTALGGELDREMMRDAWNAVIGFARETGSSAVQFIGRPGWRRSGILPDGWRHTADVVTVGVT